MQTDLLLRAHPFTMETGAVPVKSGQTLLAMLQEANQGDDLAVTLRVEVGGYEVPTAMWGRVRPKEGSVINVTRMPAGGSAKKIIRTVLLVVVAAVSIWATMGGAAAYWGGAFAAGTFGAAALGAAIGIVGALLINTLIPPTQPKLASNNMGEAGNLYGLTGSSNQINPYGSIPMVIGESLMYPPHAAMPYSEVVATESYHHYLFDLGLGEDLEVGDIKIGDTDIASFSDVDYEITRTPTLYSNDVQEDSFAVAMNDGMSATRVTAADVDEISLDVTFPQGLFGMNSKGALVQATASLTVEYRLNGSSGSWNQINLNAAPGGNKTRIVNIKTALGLSINMPVRTTDRKPFSCGIAWAVPVGQYEVRVTRNATNWNGSEENSKIGDAAWSSLRSIRHRDPSTTGTLKLAMRIRASDQLNGTLQNVSCIVRQKIKVFDQVANAWTPPIVNRSPAWIAYWLLTACPAFAVKVPESQLILQDFLDYDDFCVVNDFEIRGVLDAAVTARQLIDDVLSCGLGAVRMRDGKYGILYDRNETVPTMAFTPRDTRGFVVTRPYVRMPHAMRVRFRNPNVNWQQDEIVVPDDGYSWRGKDARGNASALPEATEFESITLRWVGDAHSAWRIARMQMAQAKFRLNSFTWETDIENLACVRGDLVYAAHDVTEWGTGWGRIKSIVGNTITIDEPIDLESGKTYSIRIRRWDGSTPAFNFTQLDNVTYLLGAAPLSVELGDIVVVGETTTMDERLLITGIMPTSDLGAKMTAVNYDSRVAPYWANPPASITSEISGTSYLDPPWAPNIVVVISEQSNSTPSDSGLTGSETHFYVPPSGGTIGVGGGGGGSNRTRFNFRER